MGDQQHRAEQTNEQEMMQRMESAHSPDRFYPRPDDVVDDPKLTRDEKLELLRNWQTHLQDRAGSLGAPRMDHAAEDDEVDRAVARAIDRLGGH